MLNGYTVPQEHTPRPPAESALIVLEHIQRELRRLDKAVQELDRRLRGRK